MRRTEVPRLDHPDIQPTEAPMTFQTLASAALVALSLIANPVTAHAFTVEAGPIWNTEDAQRKCPAVCGRTGWDGNWTTTVPGRMSVCNCGAPGGAAGLRRPMPMAAPNVAPPARAEQTIQVVNAVYGRMCPQSGSELADIRAFCGGRPVCSYRVDVKRIHDPCYGVRKDYFVEWSCGGAGRRTASLPAEANGKTITLSCR